MKKRPKKSYKRFPRKWAEWLKAIQSDVTHLRYLQQIFLEIKKIYEGNDGLRNDRTFFPYLRETYANSIAIGIRRLFDPDRRSLSLMKLMWEVHDNCHLLTRRRYVHLYKAFNSSDPSYLRRIASRDFDRLAGKGSLRFSKKTIRKDIAALTYDGRIKRVRNFVNKSLAHNNLKPLRRLPTYHDLDKALGHVEHMVKRYSALLFAQGWLTMSPIILDNWTALFKIPWIVTRPMKNRV